MDPWPVVCMELLGMALSITAMALAAISALDNRRR